MTPGGWEGKGTTALTWRTCFRAETVLTRARQSYWGGGGGGNQGGGRTLGGAAGGQREGHSSSHLEVMLHGRDSVDKGEAVAVGGPGMHHEEGSLDGGHDAVHQHPVELQHRPLLPPQILLHLPMTSVGQ